MLDLVFQVQPVKREIPDIIIIRLVYGHALFSVASCPQQLSSYAFGWSTKRERATPQYLYLRVRVCKMCG